MAFLLQAKYPLIFSFQFSARLYWLFPEPLYVAKFKTQELTFPLCLQSLPSGNSVVYVSFWLICPVCNPFLRRHYHAMKTFPSSFCIISQSLELIIAIGHGRETSNVSIFSLIYILHSLTGNAWCLALKQSHVISNGKFSKLS